MKKRQYAEALITQIPILGGIIIYKKLVDIENAIKKMNRKKRK